MTVLTRCAPSAERRLRLGVRARPPRLCGSAKNPALPTPNLIVRRCATTSQALQDGEDSEKTDDRIKAILSHVVGAEAVADLVDEIRREVQVCTLRPAEHS